MTKLSRTALCVLLALCLAGCGLGNGGDDSGAEATGEAAIVSEPTEPSVDGETRPEEANGEALPDPEPTDENTRELTIYLYRPDGTNYFPVITAVRFEPTMETLVEAVAQEMGLPIAAPHTVQRKGQLILDFNGEYIDRNLADVDVEATFFNSLCATILEHEETVEYLTFRRDGGDYRSANRTMTLDEPYQWPAFKLGGGTAAEYAVIRRMVPYAGMAEGMLDYLRTDIVPTDATGEELMRLLYRVGDPGRDVASPAELENAYLLQRGLDNVMWYATTDYGRQETYHPELRPITAAVEDDTVALGEHVEAVIRELFGEVPVELVDMSPWRWYPEEGVYTPPHMGEGYNTQPVLFDYEDLGDSYRVELTYMQDMMGSFIDEDGRVIPEAELRSAAENRMRRREVILDKTAGGALVFRSHRYLQ